MTEGQLLTEVLELAAKYDVLAFHSTDARRDIGRGFPDLVLVGQNNILFAELKSGGRTPEGEQVTWKYRLVAAKGNWVWWSPADLRSGLIEETLRKL
jgi:hypothetical protein